MAESPMLHMYKNAMQKEKTKAPYDYIAGWSNDDSRFVVTLCNNDKRNAEDHKFNIHVPVDNAIIRVVHRINNTSKSEQSAYIHVKDIISDIPINSFMMVCRIKEYCVEELRNLGECGKNDRGYIELSLMVGKLKELSKILEDQCNEKYVTVLVHIRPAFLMSGGSLVMELQDKMRNDVSPYIEQAKKGLPLTKWSPNMNIDKAEEGWCTEQTYTINDMGNTIGAIDNVRKLLFDRIETDIDYALSEYNAWTKAMGESRSNEILDNYSEQSPMSPPPWWPKRLVDIRMNALIPGENVWYFRGSFNALSYTWDIDNNDLHTNVRPFSSSQVVRTYRKDAYKDLIETVKDVDTSEYLWIDALCINQADESEKMSEVKRSPEYYKKCNKCIVLPSGLSKEADIRDLSGTTLPRWFHRAWTLQEAASAEFIVGRFMSEDNVLYLDRFEIVKLLDDNTQQSGVLIGSARQIMRRAGLNSIHPATIVEWALARQAGLDQDIIYGTASMFRGGSINEAIVGGYDKCMRCVIMKLANALHGYERTSLSTLTGKGWLPMVIREEDLAGITTESKLDSSVQSDGSLLIRDTTLTDVENVTLHVKALCIGDDYRRYSQSKSRRFYIEELAGKCSQLNDNRKFAGDNAAARAWVAVTYMSSDVLQLSCGSEQKTVRVVMMDDAKFSHLIFVGYARESIYLERVYICATRGSNGIFYKKGILAEPVGKIEEEKRDKTDVVLAEGSSCSCNNQYDIQ